MAPRERDSNELTKFLRARKEPIVSSWVAAMLSKLPLRRKLSGLLPSSELPTAAASIYDSLIIPLSLPTRTGKTPKVRLSKLHRKCLDSLALTDLQQSQLLLLDVLTEAVRKHYSANPRKIEKFTRLLNEGVHSLLLRTTMVDAQRRDQTSARAESKYARLLDMANDAIFLLNLDTGLFVEANKLACRLTGYSEPELKKMGFNSLFSVFDLNLALEKADAAIEHGAVRFDDLSIYTKRGVAVPVDISASAVLIDGVKHIFAIVRDIKERKKFEENIREKAKRLQLINEIAQAISSAGLDIEAVLTTILKSVARVVKVEAGSVLKLEGSELTFMAALGEKAQFVKPFRLKMGQGIAGWVAQNEEGVIVRDVHSDPRYYPEVERATGFVSKSILAVPMKVGDSTVGVIELINKVRSQFTAKDLELMGVISSFAGVALEHARLFSECKLARMRLAEWYSPVSSSRLAAAVAHEMKDPLGIMKNYVQILIDKLASSGARHEELVVISEEADRIVNITDQLLHFSEAYAEEPKDTPLNLLIENSLAVNRERLDKAGIVTRVKLDQLLPPVPVIPNHMKMVFSNLIKLAIAEMPDGGTLAVTTKKHDSSIRIEFSNSGSKHPGIEASEMFLPSAVAKGLLPKGLGLYMVCNIIQGYGGEIEVRPDKKGNTFRIEIPLSIGEHLE